MCKKLRKIWKSAKGWDRERKKSKPNVEKEWVSILRLYKAVWDSMK
jgi:hypothetical protein